MKQELNLPKILYEITGTFEYELLIELMLRHWVHPFADDSEFRNTLIEDVAMALKEAADGSSILGVPPKEVNLVLALWHAESNLANEEPDDDLRNQRNEWLLRIRRSLPSCFCSQDLLG